MFPRPPRLDDRRFDDLVAELVARIPAHTPEWTNPRVGDPGRTLIELFAWLGDALLYRANLIPERQRLAFLRLLGEPILGARPARGMVTISLKENESVRPYAIQPLARFEAAVPFEARNEFTVLPVTSMVFYKRPTVPGEVAAELVQALAEFHRAQGSSTTSASLSDAIQTYVTTPLFSAEARSNDAFDVVTQSADRCLWIALLAAKAPSPAAQVDWNIQAGAAIGSGGQQLLNVGIVPALPTAEPLEPVTTRAEIPHVWEITVNTVPGPIDEDHPWVPQYLPLDEVFDSTRGLTREGIVRLVVPRADILHAPGNDVRFDENAGVGDRPPRLDDDELASRLVAWIRLRPGTPPAPTPPPETQFHTGQGASSLQSSQAGLVEVNREVEHLRLLWTGINAVEVEQLTTRTNIIIGESNGAADQEFQLPGAPVEPETLRLEVEEESGWFPWQRMEDLATLDRDSALSRDARVYELDPPTGIVRFGDGIRGRVVRAGSRIRARLIRSGGGFAGNLPPGSLKAVTATTLTGEAVGPRFEVEQLRALSGGTEPESLAEAERRIPARLRHRDRAVTPDDYRILARETPGVVVGRVELLPRFKPQQRDQDIPGVVTVMALPEQPLAPAPNPRADRPFLEAVHGWLDVRRPLATELYVIGCEYIPVAISVAVTVAEGAQPNFVLQSIKDALRRVLWPMAGGGFDLQGWPLGRALSNRELAVEVARVPGVSEVAGLNLFVRDGESWKALGDSRDGQEQNLDLMKWQLPELLGVTAVADDSAAGAPLEFTELGANPFASDSALAVPIVPDLC